MKLFTSNELKDLKVSALKDIIKANDYKTEIKRPNKDDLIKIILKNQKERKMETQKTETQEAPKTETAQNAPVRLIDGTHDTTSATFKAIEAAKKFGKDYDSYLMDMLTNKVPARQAELLYKKIGSELGFVLSVNQKKTIAKEAFLANDLATQEGVDKILSTLPEKIGLSKGGVKNWMKAFCEAKKITLAKATISSAGPSTKTLEIFAFIERGHEAKKDRKTIIQATMKQFELKESTASLRYSKVAKDNAWNIIPADKALKEWAIPNARTGTAEMIAKHHPKASKAAVKQVIGALAFFQAVMESEALTEAEEPETNVA